MPKAVTKRRGFRKSVASFDDDAAPPAKEGMLKKRNKNGIWQKRFFWINNHYVNYAKHEESKVTGSDILGAVNILELDEIKETGCEFYLNFTDVSYHLKAASIDEMEEWKQCIEDRQKYFSRVEMKAESTKSKMSVSTPTFRESRIDENGEEEPVKEGWLKKKAPGTYRENWQERYIRIYAERGDLVYFKSSDPNAEEAGTVALNNMEWCRPVDESGTFEFLAANRVYQWKAESNAAMTSWMTAINDGINVANENTEVYQEARVLANTSRRILKYDSMTDDSTRTADVEETLALTFANLELGVEMDYLTEAEENVEKELRDLALECAEVPGRPARYDILAFQVKIYHKRMLQEVKPFLEALEEKDNGFIYELIMLILKYSKFLGDMLLLIPDEEHPKESLLSEVTHLSNIFVKGPNGSNTQIEKICKTAATRQIREGMGEVSINPTNGKGYTSTVIDVWKAINDHVQLARTTESCALEYLVVEGALEEFIKMLQTLQHDFKAHGMDENRGASYVCACMNDCMMHSDQVATLSDDALSSEEIRAKLDPLMDRVTIALNTYAMTGVHHLATEVMQDLTPLFGNYFNSDWKGGSDDSAGTIVATVNDYLQEYEEILVEYYVRKLAMELVSRAALQFVRGLIKLLSAKSFMNIARGTKVKFEHSEHVLKDMEILEEGLSERLKTATRPGVFLLYDDLKVFMQASEDDMIARVETVASTFPEQAKLYQDALEQILNVFVKSNDTVVASGEKNFVQTCIQRMHAITLIKHKLHGSSRKTNPEPSPYDKLALYQQLLTTKVFTLTSTRNPTNEQQTKEQDGDENKTEEDAMWIQNVDLETESQRQRAASRIDRPEVHATDESLKSVKHMEGYLDKKDSKNFWYKRWFILETKPDQKSNKRLTSLSWHLKPGAPEIHSVILEVNDKEYRARIKESKEKLVLDQSAGLLYLEKDFPNYTTVKLKSHSQNVVTLYTRDRKFKLRSDSAMSAVQWANALNEAMKNGDVHRVKTDSFSALVTTLMKDGCKLKTNAGQEELAHESCEETDATTNILHSSREEQDANTRKSEEFVEPATKNKDMEVSTEYDDLKDEEPINSSYNGSSPKIHDERSDSFDMNGPLLNSTPKQCGGCCLVS